MVSHTPAGELKLLSVTVLILIVMDNGLSPKIALRRGGGES